MGFLLSCYPVSIPFLHSFYNHGFNTISTPFLHGFTGDSTYTSIPFPPISIPFFTVSTRFRTFLLRPTPISILLPPRFYPRSYPASIPFLPGFYTFTVQTTPPDNSSEQCRSGFIVERNNDRGGRKVKVILFIATSENITAVIKINNKYIS